MPSAFTGTDTFNQKRFAPESLPSIKNQTENIMSDIITIALNKLIIDPMNVRKTNAKKSIAELAASISAEGLLQNLIVREADKKGCYFVTGGGRRLAALNLLVETRQIAKTAPINCILRDVSDATAVSLAENHMREAMNPADEFEAFTTLANEGKTIPDIAARFGTSEAIVRRRLALGRVSPALLNLYRNDDMSFDQLSAFTITDDHEAQEAVWNELPSFSRSASSIRAALAGEGVRASDKRVKFLGGLDAYEAAGGTVRRDLFDELGGYAMDLAKLEALVAAKLETHAKAVRAEGWKWVEIVPEMPWEVLATYSHVYPTKAELSDEQQAELYRLSSEYDELAELIEAGAEENGGNVDAEAKIQAIQDQITAISERVNTFGAEALESAGCIITLSQKAEIRIERGLVRPEDQAQSADNGEFVAAYKAPLTHSAKLLEDLTAQKTAAIRVKLVNRPDIALCAIVHAMLLKVAYDYPRVQSALQISTVSESVERSMIAPDDCTSVQELCTLRDKVRSQVPSNPDNLWDWCVSSKQDALLDLLAYAAALTVNGIETKFSGDRSPALTHASQLAETLGLDMRSCFRPKADNYFAHVNRRVIAEVLDEARGTEIASRIGTMKKAEAASYAEHALAETNWLPEPLRVLATEPFVFSQAAE
jgi:ParB family transcriptional regulator, chromosome partitioning protein